MQQILLLKVIKKWIEVQSDESTQIRMKEINKELDQIHFAWSDTDKESKPLYYRIQSPSLIIEFLAF